MWILFQRRPTPARQRSGRSLFASDSLRYVPAFSGVIDKQVIWTPGIRRILRRQSHASVRPPQNADELQNLLNPPYQPPKGKRKKKEEKTRLDAMKNPKMPPSQTFQFW